jgi:hypothetical protein
MPNSVDNNHYFKSVDVLKHTADLPADKDTIRQESVIGKMTELKNALKAQLRRTKMH